MRQFIKKNLAATIIDVLMKDMERWMGSLNQPIDRIDVSMAKVVSSTQLLSEKLKSPVLSNG